MSDVILFLCVANSARSQMAEGLCRRIDASRPGDRRMEIYSAGSQPAVLNPLAAMALAEQGIETAGHFSKGLDDVPLDRVTTVITLCEEEVCPRLPTGTMHLHWPLPDPAAVEGSEAERLDSFRAVRDTIDARLRAWVTSA